MLLKFENKNNKMVVKYCPNGVNRCLFLIGSAFSLLVLCCCGESSTIISAFQFRKKSPYMVTIQRNRRLREIEAARQRMIRETQDELRRDVLARRDEEILGRARRASLETYEAERVVRLKAREKKRMRSEEEQQCGCKLAKRKKREEEKQEKEEENAILSFPADNSEQKTEKKESRISTPHCCICLEDISSFDCEKPETIPWCSNRSLFNPNLPAADACTGGQKKTTAHRRSWDFFVKSLTFGGFFSNRFKNTVDTTSTSQKNLPRILGKFHSECNLAEICNKCYILLMQQARVPGHVKCPTCRKLVIDERFKVL